MSKYQGWVSEGKICNKFGTNRKEVTKKKKVLFNFKLK